MRQRLMIAMALFTGPKLPIADGPTTALDVTIQALNLDLIRGLRDETGTAVILTMHDLGVLAGIADRVVVMYAGWVFESARAGEVLGSPKNPYTRALLRSIPDDSPRDGGTRDSTEDAAVSSATRLPGAATSASAQARRLGRGPRPDSGRR